MVEGKEIVLEDTHAEKQTNEGSTGEKKGSITFYIFRNLPASCSQ